MTDPAIRAEAAHQARREGRPAAAGEVWPYLGHRDMATVMRAECCGDCALMRRYGATLERIARTAGERDVLRLANEALDEMEMPS